jgi:hypothetical protein
MPTSDEVFSVYRDLADYHERQGLGQLRDRFLVLAAASAQATGRGDEAERLRQRLLRGNPHHLLRSFTSMAQAIVAPEVQTYVEDLSLEYPLHAAQDLLNSVRAHSPPPRPTTGNLPPTAPIIDLDEPAESLKVYRHRDDAEFSATPGPSRSDLPARKSSFPVPKRSTLLHTPSPARPATVTVGRTSGPGLVPAARQCTQKAADELDDLGGQWVGVLLFVLVLVGALYIGATTLIYPILR